MIANPSELSARRPIETDGARAGAVSAALRQMIALVRTWYRTRRDRLELAQLGDHILADIGLTRADVERVEMQPFWQPIDYAELDRQRRRNARRGLRGS
jgi:uncharacterized protein YjiS (DUF1127 family)